MVPIKWVPLGDLDVPTFFSEIGDTPPDSTVDNEMIVVPLPPAGRLSIAQLQHMLSLRWLPVQK